MRVRRRRGAHVISGLPALREDERRCGARGAPPGEKAATLSAQAAATTSQRRPTPMFLRGLRWLRASSRSQLDESAIGPLLLQDGGRPSGGWYAPTLLLVHASPQPSDSVLTVVCTQLMLRSERPGRSSDVLALLVPCRRPVPPRTPSWRSRDSAVNVMQVIPVVREARACRLSRRAALGPSSLPLQGAGPRASRPPALRRRCAAAGGGGGGGASPSA